MIEINIGALVVLMGIPTAVTGFCFWMLEHRIQKREKQKEAEEAKRQKEAAARERAREDLQIITIQGNFPAGCTLQVWICNNGNDASPTWEDITQKVRAGQKHYFTNKTKTAAAWGVKVKAKLLRGSATETCYIQSIGGNFA